MHPDKVPPYFIAANSELWEAWRKIQARGEGEAYGPGWAITHHEVKDGAIMRLEIHFTRTEVPVT